MKGSVFRMKKIKIKGSVLQMSPAVPMFTALGCAAVTLGLRIWQLADNTDLATGFFREKDFFVYLFYILAVAGTLAVCALCWLCGKMPAGEIAPIRRPIDAVASVLLATSFGYEGLTVLDTLRIAAENAGLSLYDSSVLNGTFRDLVSCILAFVSMLAFVLYAVCCLTGNYKWLKYPAVLFLAAPMWGILRIISYFSYTISYLVSAELFCELYAAIFMMLFLFCFARFATGTTVEGGAWAFLASGLSAALFCLLASVPRFVAKASGIGAVEGFGVDAVYAAGFAFAITSVLSYVRKGSLVQPEETKANEETQEDGDIPVSPFTVE